MEVARKAISIEREIGHFKKHLEDKKKQREAEKRNKEGEAKKWSFQQKGKNKSEDKQETTEQEDRDAIASKIGDWKTSLVRQFSIANDDKMRGLDIFHLIQYLNSTVAANSSTADNDCEQKEEPEKVFKRLSCMRRNSDCPSKKKPFTEVRESVKRSQKGANQHDLYDCLLSLNKDWNAYNNKNHSLKENVEAPAASSATGAKDEEKMPKEALASAVDVQDVAPPPMQVEKKVPKDSGKLEEPATASASDAKDEEKVQVEAPAKQDEKKVPEDSAANEADKTNDESADDDDDEDDDEYYPTSFFYCYQHANEKLPSRTKSSNVEPNDPQLHVMNEDAHLRSEIASSMLQKIPATFNIEGKSKIAFCPLVLLYI